MRGLLRDRRCRSRRQGRKCRYAERDCTDASGASDEQDDVHRPSLPMSNKRRTCREAELDAELSGKIECAGWTVVDVVLVCGENRGLDRRKQRTMKNDKRRCCQQLKSLLDTCRVVRRMSARMRNSVDSSPQACPRRDTRMVRGLTCKCALTGRCARRPTHASGNGTTDHDSDEGKRPQAPNHLIREYKPTQRTSGPSEVCPSVT